LSNTAQTLLIIGGADTGRTPMAAAILRRLAETWGLHWQVASAGLLGHDGDPAEPEACRAMLAQSLNIDDHRARLFEPAMLEDCRVLLCIDSGTTHALRIRFPEAAAITHNLGDLAGRKRDIPDPFRMQVGAWINYAEELAQLLRAAMPRLRELMSVPLQDTTISTPTSPSVSQVDLDRLARINRLLSLLQDMPAVVEWHNAQRQISADLRNLDRHDALLHSYVDLILAQLEARPQTPAPGQIARLQRAIERLRQPLDQQAIEALQRDLVGWG
jgi:protein-tyrosine phosphatase